MSTWNPTPRGLALAAHIKRQYALEDCPPDCPICQPDDHAPLDLQPASPRP